MKALKPERRDAETTAFTSDLNEAVAIPWNLPALPPPGTLYAYRVGDGLNWSEYFHFKLRAQRPSLFTSIYFDDAQNEVKTHWSRVFREAFRDAPSRGFHPPRRRFDQYR